MLPAAPLPRRTTLAVGLAGVAVLTGCDSDGSADPDPPPTSGPEADPDEVLVDEVLAAIATTWGVTAGRREVAAVHRAHLEALGGDPADLPARRRVDTALLRRREEALRADLVAASVAAESGSLARVLASMSAAIAQQLVVL